MNARRIVVSPQHDDFPSLLAEALNALDAAEWHAARAADELQCSSTQLIQFLKAEPRAMQRLNDERQKLGFRPLR